MRIALVSPTYFDEGSLIGGGERYPTELGRALARHTPTTLVSFGPQRRSYLLDRLRVEIYPARHFIRGNKLNPLNVAFLRSLWGADVIHIHFTHTFVTDVACLFGAVARKPTFLTGHGGGSDCALSSRIPLYRLCRAGIAQSQFAAQFLPVAKTTAIACIPGGIDTERFCPDPTLPKQQKILYAGRLLPHKGINYLLEGFRLLDRANCHLTILGRVGPPAFFQHLQALAAGLNVSFVTDADDDRLLYEYRTAKVSVLPSVHRDLYDKFTAVPELMGLTLLEAQACGTPVVCTDAGAMAEFVEDRQTGMVVAQNSGDAIAAALRFILDLPSAEYARWQQRCRDRAIAWSWEAVAQQHLALYARGRSSF